MPRFMNLSISLGLAGFLVLPATIAAEANAATPAPVVAAPRHKKEWIKRHQEFNERAKQGNVDLLFLGDSITRGWADAPAWNKYYGNRNAFNAGINGDRTQNVLWRVENGNVDGLSPRLVILLIGTNNLDRDKSQDIGAGIKKVVERLREKLPNSKILVVGVFPRADMPDERIPSEITKINDVAKTAADNDHVFFLDIGRTFLAPDGTIPEETIYDGLHLTPAGYEMFAAAIEPQVSALFDERP